VSVPTKAYKLRLVEADGRITQAESRVLLMYYHSLDLVMWVITAMYLNQIRVDLTKLRDNDLIQLVRKMLSRRAKNKIS
jgi:hypothetical protein